MVEREDSISEALDELKAPELVKALKNKIESDQEALASSPEYLNLKQKHNIQGLEDSPDFFRLNSQNARATRTIMDFLKEREIIPAETISLAEEEPTDDNQQARKRAKLDLKCWETQAGIVARDMFSAVRKTDDSDLDALFQEPTEEVRLFGELYKTSTGAGEHFGGAFNDSFQQYLRDKINTDNVFSIGFKVRTEKGDNRTYYRMSLELVDDLGKRHYVKGNDFGNTRTAVSLGTIKKMIESVNDFRIMKEETPENAEEPTVWDRTKEVIGRQSA